MSPCWRQLHAGPSEEGVLGEAPGLPRGVGRGQLLWLVSLRALSPPEPRAAPRGPASGSHPPQLGPVLPARRELSLLWTAPCLAQTLPWPRGPWRGPTGRNSAATEGLKKPGRGYPASEGASLPQEVQSALSPEFSDRPLPVPGLWGQQTFCQEPSPWWKVTLGDGLNFL